VLISADTYKLVHALFDFTPLGPLEVKGKQATVEAYEVLGAKAVAGNLRRSWDEMVKLEIELCEMMFAHPDAHEGPAAFSEKREPRFKAA